MHGMYIIIITIIITTTTITNTFARRTKTRLPGMNTATYY
jgi:hypothetical protein